MRATNISPPRFPAGWIFPRPPATVVAHDSTGGYDYDLAAWNIAGNNLTVALTGGSEDTSGHGRAANDTHREKWGRVSIEGTFKPLNPGEDTELRITFGNQTIVVRRQPLPMESTLEKEGSYDASTNEIAWTVTVNPPMGDPGMSYDGYTIIDEYDANRGLCGRFVCSGRGSRFGHLPHDHRPADILYLPGYRSGYHGDTDHNLQNRAHRLCGRGRRKRRSVYIFQYGRPANGYQLRLQAGVFDRQTDRRSALQPVPAGRLEPAKVDDDYRPLAGAEFSLYDGAGNLIGKKVSGSDGMAVFDGLAPGEYTVYETAAPEGYIRCTEPWRFGWSSVYAEEHRLGDDGSGVAGWADEDDGTLPRAGGIPASLFLPLAGAVLIFTGVITMMPKKSQKRMRNIGR